MADRTATSILIGEEESLREMFVCDKLHSDLAISHIHYDKMIVWQSIVYCKCVLPENSV